VHIGYGKQGFMLAYMVGKGLLLGVWFHKICCVWGGGGGGGGAFRVLVWVERRLQICKR